MLRKVLQKSAIVFNSGMLTTTSNEKLGEAVRKGRESQKAVFGQSRTDRRKSYEMRSLQAQLEFDDIFAARYAANRTACCAALCKTD